VGLNRFTRDQELDMLSPTRLLSLLKRLVPTSEGVAAIELGFFLPLMAGLIVPLADFGMGAYTQMQLVDAAQAGADYAARTSAYGFSATTIQAAATGATGLPGITATASQVCGCVSGTTISTFSGTTPPCTQICGTGGAGLFVTVSTQVTYTPLFPYPLIHTTNGSVPLAAQAVVRIN
jgi:Flp pilus assembly protein TadG